ncbi:hypothetical protein GEMRC1_008251 [Eukaryota sp. GEM-RC1]
MTQTRAIVLILFLLPCVFPLHGVLVEWKSSNDGCWSSDDNWDPSETPSDLSSVQFSISSPPITVTIDTNVTITNLTLVDDVTLLFTNNASLTVLNSFTMYGGSLKSHSSSFLSNTSTTLLVLDGFDFSLSFHILIVTFNISWLHGVFSLDISSKLILSHSSFYIDATPELQGSSRIFVWGSNSQSKFGIPGESFLSPQSVHLPSPVREVSMGISHTLILLSNGDVYSAGSNDSFQIGRILGSRDEFHRVDIPKAVQVNAGDYSSFALMDDGTFYCWGGNEYHQLGLGGESTADQLVPVYNDYIDDIIKLSGTRNSFFGLTSNGDVYSWGNNPGGCLCLGSTNNDDRSDHPDHIKNIDPVEFVASGVTTYLIYKDHTTDFCGRLWGSPTTMYGVPTPFQKSKSFVFIATTHSSAIGIDYHQKLWSWGENGSGRLGDGTTDNSIEPVSVIEVGPIISASAGGAHKAVVDATGQVYTWGNRLGGRLARDTNPNGQKNSYTNSKLC